MNGETVEPGDVPESEIVAFHWHAELPPPEVFRNYYQVSEELGDAVVDEFRENGKHRRKMESRILGFRLW